MCTAIILILQHYANSHNSNSDFELSLNRSGFDIKVKIEPKFDIGIKLEFGSGIRIMLKN